MTMSRYLAQSRSNRGLVLRQLHGQAMQGTSGILKRRFLSCLPNANAKSQRFSYATSQIATMPPVVALNRSSKSPIAARYAAFWHANSQIALASSLSAPKSQRFKSQRLQDAKATKSQTLAFFSQSQRFSATKYSLNFILGVVLPHLLGEIFRAVFSQFCSLLVEFSRFFLHSFGNFSQFSPNFNRF